MSDRRRPYRKVSAQLRRFRERRSQDSPRQYAAVKVQTPEVEPPEIEPPAPQAPASPRRGRLRGPTLGRHRSPAAIPRQPPPEMARSRGGTQPAPAAKAPSEPSGEQMNVYLRLNRAATAPRAEEVTLETASGDVRVAARGNVAIASVTPEQLEEIIRLDDVASADMGEPIKRPLVLRSEGEAAAPDPESEARRVGGEELHRGGEGVLVGIIDVEGFDFSHPDFLDDDGKTRFLRIWDQGLEGVREPPDLGRGTRYGGEFLKKHLDGAIAASAALGIAPYHIEQQSSVVPRSHGTHVASIAAGNAGVCPRAGLAAVLIHLPEEDWRRRLAFTDSTRIADAVEYLLRLKDELGFDAVSINISLGTNGHAHDGTSGACRYLDAELDQQGRALAIAAGNAGQEEATNADDLGFIVGRIHTAGRVPAAGLTQDVHLEVAGFPIEDVSENEVEIWYGPQDRFGVSVRPPDSGRWIGPVEPGDNQTETARTADGDPCGTDVSVFNELYRPENGCGHISVFLTPSGGESSSRRVAPGTWTIRLHGREIRDGRFDGWIERDDPVPVQGLTPQRQWHYPAFFTGGSNVDRTSLSTLACTRNGLAVANLDARTERMAVTSSQGPTRDGQTKPEVCAPGTDVVAACGFHPTQRWVAMSGTSMASPYVAGVAALMLAVEPNLTAAQVRGIILRTTWPLPGADYAWSNDAGFGRISPERCIREAKLLSNALRGDDP